MHEMSKLYINRFLRISHIVCKEKQNNAYLMSLFCVISLLTKKAIKAKNRCKYYVHCSVPEAKNKCDLKFDGCSLKDQETRQAGQDQGQQWNHLILQAIMEVCFKLNEYMLKYKTYVNLITVAWKIGKQVRWSTSKSVIFTIQFGKQNRKYVSNLMTLA